MQHYHYDNMTPAQKKQKLENRQMKYKSMAGQESQKNKRKYDRHVHQEI